MGGGHLPHKCTALKVPKKISSGCDGVVVETSGLRPRASPPPPGHVVADLAVGETAARSGGTVRGGIRAA